MKRREGFRRSYFFVTFMYMEMFCQQPPMTPLTYISPIFPMALISV